MPFGEHKGKVFWTLGESYLNFLSRQSITPDTRESIEAARLLLENVGSYAVMRKHSNPRWKQSLKTISYSPLIADAYCESPNEFVYHIIDNSPQ